MACIRIPRTYDSPADKVMSKCVSGGEMFGKGRGGEYDISTRRCPLGLKWYLGLPLCKTVAALLSSHVHAERRDGAGFGPDHLACRG